MSRNEDRDPVRAQGIEGSVTTTDGRERPVLVGLLAAVFLLAAAVTTVRNPQGLVPSADPGYAPVPVPLLLVPAALTIALVLVLPRGRGSARPVPRRPRSLRGELVALVALVLAFPLLVPLLPRPEDYVLLKAALFLLLPPLGLRIAARIRGASLDLRRPAVRWWIPLLPALVLGVLSTVGPFSTGAPASWPPLAVLLVGATATAITAGLGEELMYRRLLQTRLEAVLGPRAGLLGASLLFGLMHAFSHGEGALWENVLQVIALQGTTGIALGMLWQRWRRLEVCVLAHVLLNGLGVLLHLGGLAVGAS